MIKLIHRPIVIGLTGIVIFTMIAGLFCIVQNRVNLPVSKAQMDEYASEHSRDELGARYENSTIVCKTEPTGTQKKGESVLIYANILCQEYYVKDNIAYSATGMRVIGYFVTSKANGNGIISDLQYIEQPVDYKNLKGLSKNRVNGALKGGRQGADSEADATALSILHVSSLKPEPLY